MSSVMAQAAVSASVRAWEGQQEGAGERIHERETERLQGMEEAVLVGHSTVTDEIVPVKQSLRRVGKRV